MVMNFEWKLQNGRETIRGYQTGEEEGLATLLAAEGWPSDADTLRDFLDHVLPDGLFFVVHQPSGKSIRVMTNWQSSCIPKSESEGE